MLTCFGGMLTCLWSMLDCIGSLLTCLSGSGPTTGAVTTYTACRASDLTTGATSGIVNWQMINDFANIIDHTITRRADYQSTYRLKQSVMKTNLWTYVNPCHCYTKHITEETERYIASYKSTGTIHLRYVGDPRVHIFRLWQTRVC
jgi:hypothetical protein